MSGMSDIPIENPHGMSPMKMILTTSYIKKSGLLGIPRKRKHIGLTPMKISKTTSYIKKSGLFDIRHLVNPHLVSPMK